MPKPFCWRFDVRYFMYCVKVQLVGCLGGSNAFPLRLAGFLCKYCKVRVGGVKGAGYTVTRLVRTPHYFVYKICHSSMIQNIYSLIFQRDDTRNDNFTLL